MERRGNVLSNIDWFTIAIYAALVIFGWFSVYGAVYNFDDTRSFWDFDMRYGKQLVWILCAVALAAVLLMLDSKVYSTLSYLIFAAFIVLLIITIFIAPDIKGSRSWLRLGPVNLQPAEFAKTATCLALAKYLSSYEFNMSNLKSVAKAALIILVPMGIIIGQKETGSALAYLALTLVMYREGMPGLVLLLGVCAVVYFIVAIMFGEVPITDGMPNECVGMLVVLLLAIGIALCMVMYYLSDASFVKTAVVVSGIIYGLSIMLYKVFDANVPFLMITVIITVLLSLAMIAKFVSTRRWAYLLITLFIGGSAAFGYAADFAFDEILQPHQQTRIKVTLGMETDLKKSGYNVNQSMIAIGSGQLTGKGFLQGTQTKLDYVPEQATDFIFCTVGEEHGFIGSAAVIVLFLVLMLRLIVMAERQRSAFSRIYGYCVASIFFFHLAINIGMVIGLTPVIGIPLPFFSYGGSSLWSFTILLFIFIRLDSSRGEYMAE